MSLRIQTEGPIEVEADVAPAPTRTVNTYEGARVISIVQRFGSAWISLIADDAKPKAELAVRIVGPNYPIGEDVRNYKFVGTLLFKNSETFFHFFAAMKGATSEA